MSIKNIVRNGLLAAIATTALTAGAAKADVKAFADIEISNLKVTNTAGNIINVTTTTQSSAGSAANIGGTIATSNPDITIINQDVIDTLGDGAGLTAGSPAGYNAAELVTNSYSPQHVQATSFSYGDSYLNNIDRQPNGTLITSTASTGRSVGEALLTGSDYGSTSGTGHINNTVTFQVSTTTDVTLTFDFLFDLFTKVDATEGLPVGSQASGNFILTFDVSTGGAFTTIGGLDLFNNIVKPTLGLNPFAVANINTTTPGETNEFSLSGTGASVSFNNLNPLYTYRLTFTQDTSATVSRSTTPEPMTLGLFGAGLAGLGALRRRKAA